jgi:hypothetical protein
LFFTGVTPQPPANCCIIEHLKGLEDGYIEGLEPFFTGVTPQPPANYCIIEHMKVLEDGYIERLEAVGGVTGKLK